MPFSNVSARSWYVRRASALTIAIALLPASVALAGSQPGTVITPIPVGPYQITETDRGHELFVEDFGGLLVPGKPALPSKIFAIAIPPGATFVDVGFDLGEGIVLDGTYQVPPAPLPRVIGQEDPLVYQERLSTYETNYASVYGSDDPYPASVVEFVRTAGYRKYNLVDVRVTPLVYRPLSGQLVYYPDIQVRIDYQLPDGANNVVIDNLVRTERIARDIILNHDQARAWYPQERSGDRGLFDFVIITLDSLTSSVTPLVNWETSKGRTVQVVTTSWINANYSGGYDLAANTRAFLRDKYSAVEWGIEDVLLVGDYDDVPMRRTAQDLGYGMPETDFYYAELSQPDSSGWDSDGDHNYGEDTDGHDFYNEVNVGRIPWSSASTVQSICEKSVAYEQNTDPAFKKNILLLGAFFWDDDPNPRTDNAVLMEAKVDQPWMSDWTMTRMYEQGYSTYPMDYDLTNSNVVSVWCTGSYAFVNWAGHGSTTGSYRYHPSTAFITSSNCSSLNDDYPAIIFADACSNSDTDDINIGMSMLEQGAVGFVGATKVALGCPGWNDIMDGSSQSMDYYFTTCVTSGDYTQGEAHQYALRQMYVNGLWDYNKYETYEWGALWGNPDLALLSEPPALTMSFPGGQPEYIDPGTPTDITVQIIDGGESYVPGSGLLHYRYDGGSYQTASLAHNTGNLYIATLPPASCTDTPEYYVSADGDGGTTVTSPSDAPTSVYSAIVGSLSTVMADNFETDQGWTAENLGATTGDWQRGVPVNDPGWDYDPASDSDGSGQCYLTQNQTGNTDIDDGAVRLTSPTIDMTGGDATITYDYYLYLTNSDGTDMLLVEISSNGDSGPWTEIARHDTNGGLSWRSHAITQADLDSAGVTPTANIKIRFTANDGNTQSIVEAGLDAFQVATLACADSGCPSGGASGNNCLADIYPNNGDGTWDYADDGDCVIDISDLGELLPSYGATSGMTREDGDVYPPGAPDGAVDISDLGELLAQYGDDCN